MTRLTKLLGGFAAIAVVAFLILNSVGVALAYPNQYIVSLDCYGNWAARFYVKQSGKVMVLVSGIELNEVEFDPYDTNWAEPPGSSFEPRSEYESNGGNTSG